jgi:hypothetical protein
VGQDVTAYCPAKNLAKSIGFRQWDSNTPI